MQNAFGCSALALREEFRSPVRHGRHYNNTFWTPYTLILDTDVQRRHQSRAVLPKPPHEPVSAKLAYFKHRPPPTLRHFGESLSITFCVFHFQLSNCPSPFWTPGSLILDTGQPHFGQSLTTEASRSRGTNPRVSKAQNFYLPVTSHQSRFSIFRFLFDITASTVVKRSLEPCFSTKLRKCFGMVLTKEIKSHIISYERTLLQPLSRIWKSGIVNV